MGGLLMISSSFSRFFTCLRFVRSWMSFSAGLCNPLFVVSFLVKHLVPVPEYSRFHDIDGHIGRLQDESSTWKDAAKKNKQRKMYVSKFGTLMGFPQLEMKNSLIYEMQRNAIICKNGPQGPGCWNIPFGNPEVKAADCKEKGRAGTRRCLTALG